MGGRLLLSSKLGEGSTFSFTLPLAERTLSAERASDLETV
jgi:signal transduction histidine kinase